MISFINQFFDFLNFVLQIYNIVFLIWIISSWVPVNRSNFILRFVDRLIDPVYSTLLHMFPPIQIGVMDFSPFYMFIFLMVLEYAVYIARILTESLFR